MQNKNEKIIILAGAVLIILVGAITFLRPYIKPKETREKAAKEEVVGQYPGITPAGLQEKIKNKEKITILDVRKNEDFSFEHIVDSLNIPLDGLSAAEVPADAQSFFIIVGSTEEESNEAAAIMEKKGFEKLFVLTGSVEAWIASDGQTVSWGDPTSFVNQSKVTFVSAEDLKKFSDEKRYLYVVDVRSKNKFSPHIAGAVNIPFDELEKRRGEIPASKEIVVYGETELDGFRSGVMLYDLNVMPISVMRGGFSSWKDKGYPTE